MRGNSHVRFGGRAEETDPPKGRHRASARSNHWSATEGLGMGYSLPMVSGRLGHADPSTTLRVYAHAVSGRDAELAASLGALLEDPEEDE